MQRTRSTLGVRGVDRLKKATTVLLGRSVPPWSAKRLQGQLTAVQQMLARGDKQAAAGVARAMLSQNPRQSVAFRALLQALVSPPVSAQDLVEARQNAELMVGMKRGDAELGAYVDVLLAEHIHGMTDIDAAAASSLVAASPAKAAKHVHRYLSGMVSAGDSGQAARISLSLARSHDQAAYWVLAHAFAVRHGDLKLAERVQAEYDDGGSIEDEARVAMQASRLLAEGAPGEALQVLEGLRPRRDSEYSSQLVESLFELGAHERALEYLDNTFHQLAPVTAARYRFDALYMLGRFKQAGSVAVEAAIEDFDEVRIFRQLSDALRLGGDADDEQIAGQLREYERAERLVTGRLDSVLVMYFELGLLDDVERLASDPIHQPYLGANGRYTIARTHYVRRRFGLALDAIETIAGSKRHWESEKLRSRVLFECEQYEEALEHRSRNHRHSTGLDEVVYHAYLQQRRYKEAFGLYCTQADSLRLAREFGTSAEGGPEFPDVDSRLVVPQGGPGDEILLSSTYPALVERSRALTALCDPRLKSLLERSFPRVDFLAVDRLMSRRHPGFLEPERPARAQNSLFDLFTDGAFKFAQTCDRVILGRSLPQLTLEPDWGGPYAPFIVPDPVRILEMAEHDFGPGPTIGLVWRSEFNSPMRSIHYLDVDELEPLLETAGTFVCLQHDATPAERARLEELAPSRIRFPDDIDIRDDFEAAAAFVSTLDVVVGVGTTILELSAAVGTAAVSIQPTHFSSWRRVSDDDQDYWHRDMRVATIDDAIEREVCVERARVLVERALVR